MCEKECVVGQESGVLRSQELIGGAVIYLLENLPTLSLGVG